jgi:hypothetical protein
MRKKYTEHEREIRERERVQRSKNYQERKQEKLNQETYDWYWDVLIIPTINLVYVILKFLGVFKFIKYSFIKVLTLIKYIVLKTANLIPESIKFIFLPFSKKKDTLLIFRLISFFLRLNLIFFTVLIIYALTLL